MSFFSRAPENNIALLDIRTDSIGASYIFKNTAGIFVTCYSVRASYAPHDGESEFDAREAALKSLLDTLIRTGAPLLARATGNGSVSSVQVRIQASLLDSSIQSFNDVFTVPKAITHKLLVEHVQKNRVQKENYEQLEEQVLACSLNGYTIANPIGKYATRVETTVYSSFIDRRFAENCKKLVREAFHTRAITISTSELAITSSVSALYPYENDALLVLVSDSETSIAQIKDGYVVALTTAPQGVRALLSSARAAGKKANQDTHKDSGNNDSTVETTAAKNLLFSEHAKLAEDVWANGIAQALQPLAANFVLPKTLFLIADTDVRDFISRIFRNPPLSNVWLSDTAATTIPLGARQFGSSTGVDESSGDPYLSAYVYYNNGPIKNEVL
jgi:hypothetical protein